MAFSYYKSVTLAESQSGTVDSTDWPLTICLDGNVQAADADLKTIANGGFVTSASGYDIRPYADSALTTPLTFELSFYEATTGKLVMYVKIPTLSASVDTVIYLAFGDAGITTDGSSTSTWNSAYKIVAHLPDGTTLDLTNSTSSGITLSKGSGCTATSGEINGGAAFDGSAANGYIESAAFLLGANNVTFSCWCYSTNFDQSAYLIIKRNVNTQWSLEFNAAADQIILKGGSTTTLTYGILPSNSNWHHIACTIDGTTGIIFLDGAVVAGGTISAFTDTSSICDFARAGEFGGFSPFTGKMDELRVSNVVRTGSWLLADYNSQKVSSTFITWGTKVAVSGGHPVYVGVLGSFDVMW